MMNGKAPLTTHTHVPHLFDEVANASNHGIALCDKQRRIFFANDAFLRLTGYTRKELAGRTITSLYLQAERARYTARSSASLRQHGYWYAEVSLLHKGGKALRCDFRLMLHPTPTPSQNLLLIVARELGRKEHHERGGFEGGSAAEQILESLSEALLVIDREGMILNCNKAFCLLVGEKRETIVGTPMPHHWLDLQGKEIFRTALKTARRGGSITNVELPWRTGESQRVMTAMAFSPLQRTGRKVSHFVITLRDISNVDYPAQLRRSEERVQILKADLLRKTAVLQVLQEIQRLLLENSGLEKVYRTVLAGVQRLIPHDIAGVYLIDPVCATLTACAVSKHNMFPRHLERFTLPLGKGLVGKASLTGRVVIANNSHMDPNSIYPSGNKPEREHVVVAPLRMGETIYGVLAVGRHADPVFFDEDAQIIQSFADAATTAFAASLARGGESERRQGIRLIRVQEKQ